MSALKLETRGYIAPGVLDTLSETLNTEGIGNHTSSFHLFLGPE